MSWSTMAEDHDHEAGGLLGTRKISHGLTSVEADQLLSVHGRNELVEIRKPRWRIYLDQLTHPMALMIWVAALTEAGIESWPDMSILLVILFTNASIAYYETTKADDAVAALKSALKPSATVKRDGHWKVIDATVVVPGDLVLLAAGAAVPADCFVNHGVIEVDQSALTGESMPVSMTKNDSVRMGSNIVRGEVEATVEFTGANTFFGKTAALLQQTDNEMGSLQRVLMKIIIVLVILSLTLSGIVFIYLLTGGQSFKESISFTVVLIVASIPIAIEIVCTTTLALGSKELAKHGAIVKRLSAIEDMAGMNILCCDKTGTLTQNRMVIQEETPVYAEGETQYSLLRYAALAAQWQEPAKDALDTMVLNQVDMKSLDNMESIDHMPFDPMVKRTEGTVRDNTSGKVFKTTKGAPQIILQLINDEQLSAKCMQDMNALARRGVRALAIARTVDDENTCWQLLGMLTFLDPPRHDSASTIQQAMMYGVEVKMITGDHLAVAIETSRQLRLGQRLSDGSIEPSIQKADLLPMLDPETKAAPKNLSQNFGHVIRPGNGFAQVFPEHKYLIVECLREMGFKTGMTGDGVNDAPALKRADVGIAVAGSTDAARAAADIVLTEEGLSTIVEAILVSRCIFQRMRSFLTYRVAATLQLLVFFFIAVLSMKPSSFMPDDWETRSGFDDEAWPDYFKLPVLMLMLITLLNDGTLISIGYDSVAPSKYPNEWNLPILFIVSAMSAFVAMVSSILLLYWGLSSWEQNSFLYLLGLGELSYGQITTMMYLKVSISDFLTLFSTRTADHFFWHSQPAPIVLAAACLSLTISTILACAWPDSKVDGQQTTGLARRSPQELAAFVWAYCLLWWLVQDVCKVLLYAFLRRHNVWGINNTLKMSPELAHMLGDDRMGTAEDEGYNPVHEREYVPTPGGQSGRAPVAKVLRMNLVHTDP